MVCWQDVERASCAQRFRKLGRAVGAWARFWGPCLGLYPRLVWAGPLARVTARRGKDHASAPAKSPNSSGRLEACPTTSSSLGFRSRFLSASGSEQPLL